MRASEEQGQTTVFVVGLALIGFAVTGFAIEGTRAFLMRRSLQNAADAAAVAGASQLDERSYYSSGGNRISLAPHQADVAASSSLARRDLEATAVVDASATRVHVVLRTDLPTPFLSLIGIDSVPVAAAATSEPVAGAAGGPD